MVSIEKIEVLQKQIIEKALEFGADLVGFADVEELKKSPSHTIFPQLPYFTGLDTTCIGMKGAPINVGEVSWPDNAETMVIIAISHPEDQPELDWWQQEGQPGGSPGILLLIRTLNKLAKWLKVEKGIESKNLAFAIQYGGIFVKDAVVISGVGILGKNNLVVTKKYGPRVRLRALSLPVKLGSTGPIDFDPCADCEMPCRSVCPEKAFSEIVFSTKNFDQEDLPGRTGVFDREKCNIQMDNDSEFAEPLTIEVKGEIKETKRIHFCRECEFACPVGKT